MKEGTVAIVSGFDALGVVRMDLVLGPTDGAPVPSGGFIPNRPQADLLGQLSDRAPGLLDQADTVLDNLDGLLRSSRTQLEDPASDVRQMLVSVRSSVDVLDGVLRAERDRISSVLSHVDSVTGGLSNAVSGGDSLSAALAEARAVLRRLDASLANLDGTIGSLNSLLAKVDSGQGTLGLMVNDPGLYRRTDSLLISLEALMNDFRANPGRYLKEMRIVDLF
jgi:phospholipid/cholesterol/gamma-HCH transport system substrate-binding protein